MATTPTTLKGLVDGLLDLVNLAIPLILAVVFVIMAWKLFDAWILNADNETKRDEGKKIALTGVLVLVVIVSVWGIVVMIKSSIFG